MQLALLGISQMIPMRACMSWYLRTILKFRRHSLQTRWELFQMSHLCSKIVRIFVRSFSTVEMATRRKMFLAIFSLAANFCSVVGEYNEQCPVPDLAGLCEDDCTTDAVNCIIECGDDQGTDYYYYFYYYYYY